MIDIRIFRMATVARRRKRFIALLRRCLGGNCDVPASIPPNDAGTSYNYLLVATHVVREGSRQVRANVKPCHR
jgi:hypothetical protein